MQKKYKCKVRADPHLLVQGAKYFGANPGLELVEHAALLEHLAQSWGQREDPSGQNTHPTFKQ